MGELDGRVAIVTGAGAGLGRAIAGRLADAGAHVVVFEIDGASAEQAAQELGGEFRQVDVSDGAQVDEAVRSFDRVDILVNNAGVSHVGKELHEVTDHEWHRSIDVMQHGAFYCMRAVAPGMLERGKGAIVNIASIRSETPNRERVAYCAPKAAVLMMTRCAAADWGDRGLRVNCISPGFQRTPMWDADIEAGVVDGDRLLAGVPAGRVGDPNEVGDLVVFLCSDRALYISGANVVIDGGTNSALV
jgi:NAD(P)-dependent dehydrogenase (short-subunit alcohol dehydrogenase family)